MMIENIRQALDAAEAASTKFDSQIWWRGHSAILDWHLVPSAYRTQQVDYRRYEANVTSRFRAGAGSRDASLPDAARRDQWLTLMQHYGIPTRLLDWTESVLLAIYFAVRGHDHPGENGKLFALSPHKLNMRQSGVNANFTPGNPLVSVLFNSPFDQVAPNPAKIAAFIPTEVDTRMLLQQSGFTVHGPAPSLDKLEYHEEILMSWDIPSASKVKLKRQLAGIGFNESTLFPDLEHLARYIAGLSFRDGG